MKVLPWILCAVLAAALGVNIYQSQSELRQKEVEIQRLQQQQATTQRRLAAAELPDVPIEVRFREALLASGYVAVITSRASRPIAVTFDVTRPSTNEGKRFSKTMDPRAMVEIGEMEGWAFIPSDRIKVSAPDMRPLVVTVE